MLMKPAEISLSESGKNNQAGISRIKIHHNYNRNTTGIACLAGANVESLLADTPVVTLKT